MRLSVFVFLIFTFQGFSQNEKVDKDFFDQKRYQKYSGESAVIEYDTGEVFFATSSGNVYIVTQISTRIKILNTDGFQYATVQIPLYRNRYSKETVSVTDAFTYNLEDGKVVKSKLNEESKFLENYSGSYWYASFTMPNVKVGSVIEYTTSVISSRPEDVPEWFFQKKIPVIFSQFTFQIPARLQFKQFIKGVESIKQENIKGKYVFTAQNLPPIKDEGYVSNIDNYRTSVVHYYNGFRKSNGETNFISSSWNDVVDLVNKEKRFGSRLKDVNFLRPIVYDLIKGKQNNEEKLNVIFDFVQENFEWNGMISIVAQNDLKTVFDSKEGSSGELNLLLTAMLQAAHLDAHPIILATKDKGISYMPHTNAFNNVIVGVNLNSKVVVLDATSKFSSPNIIPLLNTNWIGRMIGINGFSKEINLEPTIISKSVVSCFLKFDLNENKINGSIRNTLTNYNAFRKRSINANQSDSEIKSALEFKYNLEIDSLNYQNLRTNQGEVVEFFKFSKENAFDRVGNKIYISPAFIFEIQTNIFKQEQRNYPIDFLYPNKNSFSITYNIPEGYEIESIPKSSKIELESKVFDVNWSFTNDSKRILFKMNINYNKAIVDSNEYINIKKAFEELVKFMDEKVVLKKI